MRTASSSSTLGISVGSGSRAEALWAERPRSARAPQNPPLHADGGLHRLACLTRGIYIALSNGRSARSG